MEFGSTLLGLQVAEWRIGGVPLSAMLAAKPKGGIEITSQGVDLAGNSFSESARESLRRHRLRFHLTRFLAT